MIRLLQGTYHLAETCDHRIGNCYRLFVDNATETIYPSDRDTLYYFCSITKKLKNALYPVEITSTIYFYQNRSLFSFTHLVLPF
ncbi:hypothetical protein GDO78_010383 [Eleutherodactylus coqui]|uniref:Uncharacterized protein n=1 Tax=Eleutherodactylus coqui TaxID=57060 RepID=A0A8J6F4S3_ELECQ|nr:hypothetical protein GDO78_010383 [Eleutherodactylus coqui]